MTVAANVHDPSRAKTREADVVVLGAGLAGLTCALVAAQAGVSVLILEKLERLGGSTVLSGGSIAFAETEEQRAASIADSVARFRSDLMESADRPEAQELIDTYLKHQGEAYQFLKDLGIEFGPIQSAARQSVPRSHPTDPSVLIDRLARELAQCPNATLLKSAKALRLIRDGDARVTAVSFEHDGAKALACARRGVVLATGGFSRDEELLDLFAPRLKVSRRTGGDGSTGDGTRMALAMGAIMADLDILLPTFGCLDEAGASEPNTILLPVYKGGIAIDRSGKRFANESLPYKTIGRLALDLPGAVGFQVFDDRVMRSSARQPKTYDFKRALELKRVIAADSIESLAAEIHVDPTALEDTIDKYNADVKDTGVDSVFGRATLVHTQGRPFPLIAAPFYAYPTATFIAGTWAGVRINRYMQMLDVWHEPIPGLFGAGEVTGGIHGKSYMTGTALGKAVIFGMLAGRAASAEHPDGGTR